MTKVEINDKVYSIPSSFDELSLADYCRVFKDLRLFSEDEDESVLLLNAKVNESIIISRLMGEDDEFCMDIPIELMNRLTPLVDYIYDVRVMLSSHTSSVVIDKVRYFIPMPNEMSLRQYIDAEEVMKEDGDNQYINLLGVLLSRRDSDGKIVPYDGKYQEMANKVGGLKCSVALPLVYGFFQRWLPSRRDIKSYLRTMEGGSQQVHNTQDS